MNPVPQLVVTTVRSALAADFPKNLNKDSTCHLQAKTTKSATSARSEYRSPTSRDRAPSDCTIGQEKPRKYCSKLLKVAKTLATA
jgi:hypothetical protein